MTSLKVQFAADGHSAVEVKPETHLIDALLQRHLEVKQLCGRRGLCATCHVYVTKKPESLTETTPREAMTLSVLTGARANSRLSCQAKVIGDDVEIALPEGLYIDSFESLEKLIGQRTQVPILHPVTGDVLVAANKIIIRSSVEKLEHLNFDIAKVQLKNA
ncbi:2Fe-2S iron-sulfur cluster-binding protein [Methylosoma difficile]